VLARICVLCVVGLWVVVVGMVGSAGWQKQTWGPGRVNMLFVGGREEGHVVRSSVDVVLGWYLICVDLGSIQD
jgi:hypothetical protein